jgi:L-ascorbate metabolism protein UlaG (beta-lactamase superfamily)
MPIQDFETDRFETSAGELQITFLGHGSLLFTLGEKTLYVDPFGRVADYSTLPQADIVLITHEHRDHLDPDALESIRTAETELVCPELCAERIEGGTVMRNGDVQVVEGVTVEAVPAYNLIHKRESGDPYHPPGHGNGYVITFDNLRVLVAADTENTPELKALTDIDVAFLPMNLPYTMTPEMVADAAISIAPRILYPYHFGGTDTAQLVELLEEHPNIEVRIRALS